jgi:putative ABC transport system permease protein
MLQDVRYALRLVWNTPVLSGVAILALALGIGATTAMFSVVSGVLLQPLPYRTPDSLVTVMAHSHDRADGTTGDYTLTGAEAAALRELTDVFDGVAIVELWNTSWEPQYALTGGEHGERLRGALADPHLFEVLGVVPVAGRSLRATDGDPDAVVISYNLWRRQFGRDPNAVGRALTLNGQSRTVVGVLPPDVHFTYPEEIDVYLRRPVELHDFAISYEVVARLKPGVSPEAATASLTRLTDGRHRAIRPRLEAHLLHRRLVGKVSFGLWLVTSAAGVLCLTAAMNAALLLLTRTMRRLRSLGIRFALGATRWRILRQVLMENVVTGVLGLLGGVALAYLLLPVAVTLAPPDIPRLNEAAIDKWSLAFATLCGLACIAVSAIAAYGVARGQAGVTTTAQLGAHTTPTLRSVLWRRVLLATQATLLVTAMAVAGILLHSFLNVWAIDLGFESAGLTVVQVTPARGRAVMPADTGTIERARTEQLEAAGRLAVTMTAARDILADTPGIEQAALAYGVPLELGPGVTFLPQSRNKSHPEGVARISVNYKAVTDGFLEALRISVQDGRAITRDDVQGGRKVMVVSEVLARHFFGGESAVGRTIDWDEPYEIVGVVKEVRWESPEVPGKPAFYVPLSTTRLGLTQLVVRSSLPAGQVQSLIRDVVRRIDPQQPLDRVTSLDDIVARALAERRFYAAATSAFGLLGLVLAAIGIFGAVAASVEERHRDIGIRVALGASRAHVHWYAMRHSIVPVIVGMTVGAGVAAYAVRLAERLLYQVDPFEPWTLATAGLTIATVALLSAWLPARWAGRIAPATVLREE